MYMHVSLHMHVCCTQDDFISIDGIVNVVKYIGSQLCVCVCFLHSDVEILILFVFAHCEHVFTTHSWRRRSLG